jgi:DNA-binding MarR family transcriptional regulator
MPIRPHDHRPGGPEVSEDLPRVLATRMGFLLNRTAVQMRLGAQEILKPLKLSPPHFGVMATLQSEGPLTQKAIGMRLKIDPTTMVWLVDDLEKLELVQRGAHPKDRRAYLVNMTPAGHSAFRQASAKMERLEEEFLSPLSKSERTHLRRLLIKLFRSVSTVGIAPHFFKKDAH